jgi:hypothetical protein
MPKTIAGKIGCDVTALDCKVRIWLCLTWHNITVSTYEIYTQVRLHSLLALWELPVRRFILFVRADLIEIGGVSCTFFYEIDVESMFIAASCTLEISSIYESEQGGILLSTYCQLRPPKENIEDVSNICRRSCVIYVNS